MSPSEMSSHRTSSRSARMYSAASAAEKMSGSLTTSTSGTPARLRSTSEVAPPGRWVFLPASSSRWMRVKATRRAAASPTSTSMPPPSHSGCRTARSDSPWAGRGRSSACGRSATPRRCGSRTPGPGVTASSSARRLNTGRRRAGPAPSDRSASWAAAPNAAAEPENALDRVASWTCTSSPMTGSQRLIARLPRAPPRAGAAGRARWLPRRPPRPSAP